ncbi:hypothetical protein BD779DRAFT_1612475 [Infundibulicybe gibba]|nr:hypothetical protein BD779DRAFT_1612475 [Infundibulicybe gibba]
MTRLNDHNLDSKTHALTTRFDVQILEEAAYVLWYIWKDLYPRYSTIPACIHALESDAELYCTLKTAQARGQYSCVRDRGSCAVSSHVVREDDIDTRVRIFLDELRPAMTKLVHGEITLPLWCPEADSLEPEVAAYITALRIPYLKGKPNVLLHDLGSFKHDPSLKRRIQNIFMPNSHSFLVNTSGSGKTRLLLEGLCQNWGFYFTSLVDSSLLGSSDVQNSIRTYIPDFSGFLPVLPSATSQGYELGLKNNREIAGRVFSQLFLARLIVFDLFTEIMSRHRAQDGCQDRYKERWLLLQLQPSLLHSQIWDIFDNLVGKLSSAPASYINAKTKELLLRVRKLCVDQVTTEFTGSFASGPVEQIPIFCVLDEAQYAATEHSSAFRSEQNGAHRPILREIVRAWESQSLGQGVFMVVAGTGISKDVVDQAMASAIMKDSKYRWCSDTGAFDDVEVQRKYVLKYLPPWISCSAAGKRLLERIWYWLHGRHRFTAGFIAELLGSGFRKPHQLLNAYIEHFTQFNPTDAKAFVKAEGSGPISISSRYKLDFCKLTKNSEMIATIHQLTTHYLMRSVLPGALGKDEETYVEYGFARFVDSDTKTVAVDEPLVLLAANRWINANYRTSYKFFAKQIHTHEPSSNGFENYVAFCLNLIFSEKRRLNQVFQFVGAPPTWANQRAELVALHRPLGGVVEDGPVRHSDFSGPSVTLGANAKTLEETFGWLDHLQHTPFCFPHVAMGPDIIFILKLSDGTFIWVALQAKYSQGKNGLLSRNYLRHAIRSVTPSNFFLDKDNNPYAPTTHPRLPDAMNERLAGLPHKRPDAGRYSLLRVVISFPAKTNIKRCAEEDPDTDGHPIACLNMVLLKELTRGLSPVGFLDGLEPGQDKKRKNNTSDHKNAPKN